MCIISLSVSLLDISRTLVINYRWPAAIGLVPFWQPAKYVYYHLVLHVSVICLYLANKVLLLLLLLHSKDP